MVESFSMAARRFVVVVKWPEAPDPPSSTELAGDRAARQRVQN